MPENKRRVDDARAALRGLDEQILAALDKRALLSRELQADLGAASDVAAIAALEALAVAMPSEDVRLIFTRVHAACVAVASPLVVAYAGPAGGGGYCAARTRFGAAAELVASETAEQALDEVSRKRASFAVVPLETLGDGPVKATLAALIQSDLRISGVVEVSHDLDLYSLPGSGGAPLKVYATAADHALAQVALDGSGLAVIDVASPRLACERAAADDASAALASEAIGCAFGLVATRRGLSTLSADKVRYAIASSRGAGRSGDDATTCVFGVHDAPGALLSVLAVFAERGINLTRIHSRPSGAMLASVETHDWSYLFFIEVAGHASDRGLVTALEEVRRKARFFKVLGSYPATR